MPPWVEAALAAAKRVPWRKVIKAVAWLVMFGRKYWDRLSPEEREEVLRLIAKSKGRRSNLSKKELDRLSELFRKIREDPER